MVKCSECWAKAKWHKNYSLTEKPMHRLVNQMKLISCIGFFMLLIQSCAGPTEQTIDLVRVKLEKHTVMSNGHPLALWSKVNPNAKEAILFVHGRTWSALPDFDLQVEGEDLSLMDGLVAQGYAVYAIDGRGYGETPRDSTGWFTPDKAANDVASALTWINEQEKWTKKPHLFGWSMGSTMSQLTAQRHPELISSLTLFGYWYDADMKFPVNQNEELQKIVNTAESAASDFIIPGSISQNAIDAYVEAALKADPIKVDLGRYDQFNELDPAKVIVPTLILQGEFDPIGPTEIQSKLFTRLGTAHKQWTVIPGGDHAAFMETPRDYFIYALVNFLQGTTIH
jgi:pimeloyl-ACP methyl ester carboxylesterase